MSHQIKVSQTLYEIKVSADHKTVTIWAGGNSDDSPVEHFGADASETEEEIVDQVKQWLIETWGN